jgi:outer membrane murein-binding lipoprotein Lpp
LFFALVGVMAMLAGFFKYYLDAKVDTISAKIDGVSKNLDAKVDPIGRNVDQLVHFMMDHHDRIARLEERTK